MLLSVGKPMIDIMVKVDASFLNKYGLKPNNAIKATQSQAEVFKEVLTLQPKFILGGSVTNTLRVFQWAMSNKEKVFYIGVIGKDGFGLQIKSQLENEKIDYSFLENSLETVQCAVLISNNGKDRSLVSNSNLKSTKIVTKESIEIEKFRDKIMGCSCFYVPTFSLVMFSKLIKEIVGYFKLNLKKIVVNLGASYIIENYSDDVKHLIKFANVVIGNDEEYRTLAKSCNIQTMDLPDLLSEIKSFISVEGKDTILVVTRGDKDILVLSNEPLKHFKIDPGLQILDTTGAGDAFAGGFLTQFVKNLPLENCIYCGIACANHVIQHLGCDFDTDFNRDNLFKSEI